MKNPDERKVNTLSRYAVIDLEMCRVRDPEKKKQFGRGAELIQIGAVLLDESLEPADTFMSYVKPEYGAVDRFIEKLTGITPEDVADAPPASEALAAFLQWLPEDVSVVSWSETDRCQIEYELESKHIDLPGMNRYLESWIDSQAIFGEKMKSGRSYKLSEALMMTAIWFEDGEHDALVDAKNTALLFKKLMTEPVLRLSPYLITEDDDDGSFGLRTSGLLPGLVTT